MDKVDPLVCNKRVIESLVKAGAFDDMGHGRRALVAIHEQAVDRYVLDQEGLRRRPGLPLRRPRWAAASHADLRHDRRRPRHRRVGQDDPARPRARDARPLRLRPPADGARAPPGRRQRLQHRSAAARRGASRQQPDHGHRPDHRRCSARSPARATPGRWSRSRTSTARSTCCCSPAPTSSPAACSPRTRSSPCAASCPAARTQPEIRGEEVTVPDLTDDRTGPVVVSLPITRCTPPVVDQLKEVLRTHPGVTEVHLRLLGRAADHGDAGRRQPPGGGRCAAVRRPQAAAGPRVPERMTTPR